MKEAVEEFETREHVIQVAWDKKNNCFVAYSGSTCATGVDVETAKWNYITEFNDKMSESFERDLNY